MFLLCPVLLIIFQSTPPARGATITVSRSASIFAQYFNPRPPRGGRLIIVSPTCCAFYFNPRPPRGGRLCDSSTNIANIAISIHAPREGGDKNL